MKIGQQVICIHKGSWYKVRTGWKRIIYKLPDSISKWLNKVRGPKYNEQVEIVGKNDNGYLALKGYESNGCYDPQYFRTLDKSEEFADEVIEKMKEQIKEELVVEELAKRM